MTNRQEIFMQLIEQAAHLERGINTIWDAEQSALDALPDKADSREFAEAVVAALEEASSAIQDVIHLLEEAQ
jgi:hypothetical protein